jgi:hypothetical protein
VLDRKCASTVFGLISVGLEVKAMSDADTLGWAASLKASIDHAISAHSQNANSQADTVRFHDGRTPYVVHPIWCAMTLLAEPALSEDIRRLGACALLWHDTLEDTTMPLPSWAEDRVRTLVEEMSFESFQQETEQLWSRSDDTKLLKLFDKVSNLLDGTWMKAEKWNAYVDHTEKLADYVESRWGALNIVRIARTFCVRKPTNAQHGVQPEVSAFGRTSG